MGVVDGCQIAGFLLPGLRNSHLKGWTPRWLWHPRLLIQQEMLDFTYTIAVFLSIPKKGNVKECSNYHAIALISHASKVILKLVQARLQQYMSCESPDIQAGFRKGRGTRDQIANICWIMEKARVPEKHLFLLYWLCQSLWLCGSQQTVGNSSRDGTTRPPDLSESERGGGKKLA